MASKTKEEGLLSDFEGFEKEHGAHHVGRCWTCSLPAEVLAVVNKLRKRGKHAKMIASWLKTKGFDASTSAKVNYHFQAGHHDR